MERKIDEQFNDEGILIKCIKSTGFIANDCKKCYYGNKVDCQSDKIHGPCAINYRNDKKNVIFIKAE
jgi:hypothetical protein